MIKLKKPKNAVCANRYARQNLCNLPDEVYAPIWTLIKRPVYLKIDQFKYRIYRCLQYDKYQEK
jgi:hypothetical protein